MSTTETFVPRSGLAAFRDAVAAELSKVATLPASWMTICATVVLSAILSLFFASQAGGTQTGSLDVALAAVPYSQAGLFVLGVVIACSEYVGGQVRTTLVAMPHRITQRLAATLALVCMAVPAAAATILASLATATAVLGDEASFPAASEILGTVLNAIAYLSLMVVLSAGVGSLVRRALPAAGALVLYLVVVSPMLLGKDFAYWLPDIAGYTLWFTPPENSPGPGLAWAVVVGWTIAVWTASAIAAQRRDV